jgi:hypothetical protein
MRVTDAIFNACSSVMCAMNSSFRYTVNGTCLFSTYDVTSFVKSGGDNVVGVFLGNGM